MIKVLIAEDEPLIAKALAKLIINSGMDFEVAGIAENGREAVDLYEKHLPEVVFTDIKMPIMDGFEFLQILKDRQYEPCTIILSGFEDFNYARQAISYQVLDYLLKPISKQMLTDILNRVRIISLQRPVLPLRQCRWRPSAYRKPPKRLCPDRWYKRLFHAWQAGPVRRRGPYRLG